MPATKSRFWHTIVAELGHLRFWVLFATGVLLLLVSITWDAYHAYKVTEETGAPVLEVFFYQQSWITLLRELGFACLIALILSAFVEASSADRQEVATAKQRQAISENVFRGVFACNLPGEIVDAATRQILRAKVVRLQHKNDLILQEISAPPADDAGQKYLELVVTSEYTLKNVCDETVSTAIRLGFPIPGPETLREYAKLDTMNIGGHKLTDVEIQEGDRAAENRPGKIRYCWDREMESGEELRVITRCTLIKGRSDNEVWRSLYPGLRMELNFTVNAKGLTFGAHALNEKQLDPVAGQGNTGLYRWILDGPVLPHQAIVVWWRPQADTAPAD